MRFVRAPLLLGLRVEGLGLPNNELHRKYWVILITDWVAPPHRLIMVGAFVTNEEFL